MVKQSFLIFVFDSLSLPLRNFDPVKEAFKALRGS